MVVPMLVPSFCQQVPHPVNNTGIYDFLDELASDQIITIISAIKPYSRLYISRLLQEAAEKPELLTSRQKKELDFYMADFGKELEKGKKWNRRKDLFYYNDSLFSFTINPVLGAELLGNSSGKATYWRNGAEARGYVQNWGFYASLRDNHEKPLLGLPVFLTQREGGHIKGSTDWSEMQGGVTYSWKWGYAGLVKEKIEWGNNYNGANILGGNNPSFIHFRLNLNPVKWFSFNYFHGWLNSMVVDSTRSYWVANSYGTDYREVYHKKFIAANMFTFMPLKNLHLSTGNSIIYNDTRANPAYLVPLFFYKSVDHSLTSGIENMNSQMFFDISSRQIKHLHIYVSLFIDELSTVRIPKKDEWNLLSWKTGCRLSNYPLPNLSLTTEFTYSYPLTFQHYVPTLTFESNNYNLGHYLRDNAKEWFIALDYKPVRTMDIRLFFLDAARGPDFTEMGGPRLGNPPLDTINWQNTSFGLNCSWQVINDVYTWGSLTFNNTRGDARWSPAFFSGRKKTLNFGVTIGF
jgi:hypothetical protein